MTSEQERTARQEAAMQYFLSQENSAQSSPPPPPLAVPPVSPEAAYSAPTSASIGRPRRNGAVLVAAITATVCVAVGGVTAWKVLGGGLDVQGSVTIYDTRYGQATMGMCSGAGLDAGSQVKIEADGETLGVGRLDDGNPDSESCVMSFSIHDVDGGHEFYSLTMGEHPPYELSRAELDAPIELSLD